MRDGYSVHASILRELHFGTTRPSPLVHMVPLYFLSLRISQANVAFAAQERLVRLRLQHRQGEERYQGDIIQHKSCRSVFSVAIVR